MLFNSETYLLFLPIVVLLFWSTPHKWRPALLLVASYVFYMFWKPIYIVLIVAATAVNFWFGLRIAASEQAKKKWLVASIAFNIIMLGFFKYAYFVRDVLNIPASWAGYEIAPIPFEIILPLGISFFVFEFIHYVVDVYKGSKPITSFVDFALFPSFFPTQIAGPIKRFQDFVPQLRSTAKLTMQEFDQGVELVLLGLFKKVVLADNIGMVVQTAYANPGHLTSLDAWMASYAFLLEVYFDFGGYTDIARGSAKLLGFKVPKNFDLPILSDSIQTFWQRWHMSLSLWLRDYVYFPVKGEKKTSLLRKYGALLFTMLVCGLWHGAAPHFLMFGLSQGIFLVIHQEWRRLVKSSEPLTKFTESKPFHLFAIALSLQCLVISLSFFRADKVPVAFQILGKMLCLDGAPLTLPFVEGSAIFAILPGLLVVLTIVQAILLKLRNSKTELSFSGKFMPLKAAYIAVLICLLMTLSPDATPRFVYFQF